MFDQAHHGRVPNYSINPSAGGRSALLPSPRPPAAG